MPGCLFITNTTTYRKTRKNIGNIHKFIIGNIDTKINDTCTQICFKLSEDRVCEIPIKIATGSGTITYVYVYCYIEPSSSNSYPFLITDTNSRSPNFINIINEALMLLYKELSPT